jgi:hypothetical protein
LITTPRIEDFMMMCPRCKILKHLAFFPVKKKNACNQCKSESSIISRKKNEVRNVLPIYCKMTVSQKRVVKTQ